MAIDKAALQEALNRVSDVPAWRSEQGDYAEYMDERFPNAGVCIRRKNGSLVAVIDTTVWDAMQARKKAG